MAWISDGEDGSSSTFNGCTSNLSARLPDDLSGVQEFWTTDGWRILAPRDVRQLAIVPLLGDSIADDGCEIQAVEVAGGCTICRKVLAISTAIHGPGVTSVQSRSKVEFDLHVVCENAAVSDD